MRTVMHLGTLVVMALALTGTTVQAADPAVNCEAGKLKEAGKYGNCRLKADSKGVKKGLPADYTKCETKFADKWAKTETKAGPGICPSEGDQASMDARITTDAAEVATLLAGGTLPNCGDGSAEGVESCDGTDLGGADCLSLGFASGTLSCTAGCGFDVSGCVGNPPPDSCGDGVVDVGEDCDQTNLNGETCATQGQFGGGLACGAGCVFDTSGCSLTRYEDTGLGSVIDHQTGLEWQKTDDAGGLTDKDNTYTWTVGFDEGHAGWTSKSSNSSVWCVRGPMRIIGHVVSY